MTPQRRLGTETAKNRILLIKTAERLLIDEGYAAVTARKVASAAGLKVPLVYYYFQTMDDLLLEVVRKNIVERKKRFVRALASPDPLKEIWNLNRNQTNTISATEMLTMANHREALRPEIVAAAKEFRALQIEAVDRLLEAKGIDREKYPAGAIVTIVAALTRAMSQDNALGVSQGYDEAVKLVESGLDFLFGDTLEM